MSDVLLAYCDERGHDFDVFCKSPPEPHLVVCSRCKKMWPVAIPNAPVDVVEMAGPSETKPVVGANEKAPKPRQKPRVVEKRPSAPRSVPARPVPPAVEDESEDESDTEEAEPAEDEDAESEAEPTGSELICGNCGGQIESPEFAELVAKNFKKAQLCRDCVLNCESCGQEIESMDQARFSAIRWKSRLCRKCHSEGGAEAASE